MEKSFFHFLTVLTVIIHFLFILFVIVGGFFALRRTWSRILHVFCVAWAIIAELSPGIVCPLTAIENYVGLRAGIGTYEEDFITRYLVPIIYQEGVSVNLQLVLIGIVVVINAIAYYRYWKKK